MKPSPDVSSPAIPRARLGLFCLATALSVAAVVYHQSIVQKIAAGLQVPPETLWTLSVATQVGYGAGLILGLPLGDLLSPRRLITGVVTVLGAVVCCQALVPTPGLLVALCFLAGLLSIGGQLLIAYAAKVCTPAERPKTVGALLSALFAGLLLARALAGWGAEQIGWRTFYLLAGVATSVVGLLLASRIQDPALARGRMSYATLLGTQFTLWRSTPELRRLSFVAACFFAALNGIWANLASLAHETLHWSAAQTGLLAFTAIAGLRSPAVVAFLRRRHSAGMAVLLLGLALAASSLSGFVVGPEVAMVITFLVMADVTVRSVHVLCQGQALSIDPAAASRINSLFMTVFFFGAALGSWLGGIAVHHYGWAGMYLFPALCAVAGTSLMWLKRNAVTERRPV